MPGFCPKLLAVRPVPHARNISASLFRLHIYYLFTLLGLSLPYRIWFAKHCDEVRVSVVKETSDSATIVDKDENTQVSETKSSWLRSKIWGTSTSVSSAAIERKKAQELFRKSMQSFSLYEDEPTLTVSNTRETEENSAPVPVDTNEFTPNNDNSVLTPENGDTPTAATANTHAVPEQYSLTATQSATSAKDATTEVLNDTVVVNATSDTSEGLTTTTTPQ